MTIRTPAPRNRRDDLAARRDGQLLVQGALIWHATVGSRNGKRHDYTRLHRGTFRFLLHPESADNASRFPSH